MSNLKIDPEYYQCLFSKWTNDDSFLPDFPSDQRERLVALHFIMMAFEECTDYREKDVDEGIKDRNLFAIDHVQIRIALVTNGFLSQTLRGKDHSYRSSNHFLQLADWNTNIPGTS